MEQAGSGRSWVDLQTAVDNGSVFDESGRPWRDAYGQAISRRKATALSACEHCISNIMNVRSRLSGALSGAGGRGPFQVS